MVNVSVVVPFSAIVEAPNCFENDGGTGVGDVTVMLAEAVLPGPPSVELTATVLFLVPPLVPITLMASVHELPGVAMLPPDSITLVEPAVAVGVPPHVFVNPFGVATVKPAGNVSVNAIPVS